MSHQWLCRGSTCHRKGTACERLVGVDPAFLAVESLEWKGAGAEFQAAVSRAHYRGFSTLLSSTALTSVLALCLQCRTQL